MKSHVFIMNIKSKGVMTAAVGATIFVLLLVAFVNSYILSAIISSERIGFYEISAMRAARADNEASTVLNHGDIDIRFPLPNGAVAFENETYPIDDGIKQFLITTEAFQHYTNELLPQKGFKVEQFGALLIVESIDNTVRVDMVFYMFTRNFMRVILNAPQ